MLSTPDPAEVTQGQRDAFAAITAHPDSELLVATLEGEVIGTFQLTFLPGLSSDGAWRAQVEAVRVRDDLRSRGIGAQMIEWAITRAREHNCWMIQLTSNRARIDAHRFYERLGFKASHVGMKLYL